MKTKPYVLIVFAVIISLLAVNFLNQPRTPAELYKNRCGHCHDLPDLSAYKVHEIDPLIDFMRHHNGAKRIISAQEANVISAYLKKTLFN
ncbi:MAG TPA: hypothetical protein ENJ08_04865 [Gammaproteobacteria bacterium]|nr:hypothetical protein [Gammaproteobacteria bacterium]